jgi:hypothetical protein
MAIAPPNGNGRQIRRAHVTRHGRTAEIALTGELDLADRSQLAMRRRGRSPSIRPRCCSST